MILVNMKILITGALGQLGRAFTKEMQKDEVELIRTSAGIDGFGEGAIELDITNLDNVLEVTKSTKPDVIVNCAAYTAVDQQEKDVDPAYKINAIGPRNLAIAAQELSAKLVHVSTDYVFDGKGTSPYTEFDKPNPVSIYGKTKLAGEEFVKQFSSRSFILRTAWLYGEGRNFLKTMLKLSETHDEISVVDDQLGSPTSAAELARAVRYIYKTDNYGLFHATCEGSCAWADFSEEIFRLTGKSTRVNRVSSRQYKEMNPDSADRPAYSILDNYMFKLTSDYRFAGWKAALEEFLKGEAI